MQKKPKSQTRFWSRCAHYFSNLITVKNTTNNSTIIIIDVLGKVVFEKQESSTETEIDLSYLTTGFYQLIVKGDNSSYTHKIVKQ